MFLVEFDRSVPIDWLISLAVNVSGKFLEADEVPILDVDDAALCVWVVQACCDSVDVGHVLKGDGVCGFWLAA